MCNGLKGVPTIGQFNRRITVKENVTVKNSAGDIINNGYNPLYETWAAFEPNSSRAQFLQSTESLHNVYEVWIRETPERSLALEHVIEYEGENFVLTSLTEVRENNKRFLNFLMKEQTTKG